MLGFSVSRKRSYNTKSIIQELTKTKADRRAVRQADEKTAELLRERVGVRTEIVRIRLVR